MNLGKGDITIRAAKVGDADGMSVILDEILTTCGSDRAHSPEYTRAFYIEHPDQISCVVAVNGTYVKQGIGRSGIGSKLFTATSQSARQNGMPKIDATISESNAQALSYYEAMGFWTYRKKQEAVCKCYRVALGLQE